MSVLILRAKGFCIGLWLLDVIVDIGLMTIYAKRDWVLFLELMMVIYSFVDVCILPLVFWLL